MLNRRSMKVLNRGSHSYIHNSHNMIHSSLLKRNNNLKKKRGSRIKSCNLVRRTTLKGKCKRTAKASIKNSKTVAKMRGKMTRVKSPWSMC